MKIKARLILESKDAKVVSKSLDIDNVLLDNLKIKTYDHGNKVVTEIKTTNLKSLLNTIEDLLQCYSVAEKLV
ncbi:MAG: hypothetical protein DRO65_04710 [Candidatus Altiarchaeales archaeon]|nr:MAG: hypothetical protein DRO65_04710 [Candidatus Altiarchaeales archaeon]